MEIILYVYVGECIARRIMEQNLLIKDLPKETRPYEKCLKYGTESLSNEELLAIIIRTGAKGEGSFVLASRVLNSCNQKKGLIGMMHLSTEELMSIKGIGKVKAVQIKCICELSKRISMANYEKQLNFREPASIANYYMERFRHLEAENTVVVFLDTKCNRIDDKVLFTGTVNKAMISAREIFIAALRCNAVNIVLIHNHPSGDVEPSKEDIISTKKIQDAGRLIGIALLDHIIIGDRRYTSLRQAGYLI